MASSQDKFRKTAGVPSTTLSSAISATDDVISFANTTDWPTDTGIDIVVDRIDQNGNLTPEKKEVMTVVVNENTGVQAIRGINGNACAHDAGAIVEPSVVSAKGHNDMIDGILNIHKQDGTLKDKVVKAQNIDFANFPDKTIPAQSVDFATETGVLSVPSGYTGSLEYLKQGNTVDVYGYVEKKSGNITNVTTGFIGLPSSIAATRQFVFLQPSSGLSYYKISVRPETGVNIVGLPSTQTNNIQFNFSYICSN